MALLRRFLFGVAAAAASACYSPSVRDCTVSCEAPSDCAHGQVCGADHLCAAPSIAGACAQQPKDAGVDGSHDSSAKDAPVAIDAAPIDAAIAHIDLHVKIDGMGRVVIDNVGTCDTTAPTHGDCHYSIVAGATATLHEMETTQKFDKWTGACNGSATTCMVSSLSGIDVHARFVND